MPNVVTSLTSNLSSAKTQAAQIGLMTANANNMDPSKSGGDNGYEKATNDADTNLRKALQQMNTIIPAPGPGSPSSPRKVLFIVSDGVDDELNPPSCSAPNGIFFHPAGRCLQTVSSSLCDAIKTRGIKIAVLYTTYLPIPGPGQPGHDDVAADANPILNLDSTQSSYVSRAMQACASPGLYFEVSPSQGIASAMTALFQKSIQEVHLTQ
jgi:hypothetical protein